MPQEEGGYLGEECRILGEILLQLYLPADSSSLNSLSPSEALWSTPKQVPKINRVLIHCPRAIEKLRGRVTLLCANRISTLAKEGAPVPEATMA